MSRKADRFYFENFIACADCACGAASYLEACLSRFDPEELPEKLTGIHEVEHQGDMKKHEMSEALAKAFVTPLEREDIALLSQNIDEVTDYIEDVLQRVYINNVRVIRPDAVEFAHKIVVCCEMMKQMLESFESFRRDTNLKKLIIDLNHLEEDCDVLFLNAMRKLHTECKDPIEVIAWREVYTYMERCADACEHVADAVEMVVMKNT